MTSRIEWTDQTWNVVTGCTPVSPGCDRCYAEAFTHRFAGVPGHPFTTGFTPTMHPDRLAEPLTWRRPRRVFVAALGDLFHHTVDDEFLAAVFAVMAATPQHTYQILTKRHARMRSFLRDECRCGNGHAPGVHLRSAMDWAASPSNPRYVPGLTSTYHTAAWPLPNVWVGVSAENQHWADIRIPALLDTPAALRWVSCEPLLGPVDLACVCRCGGTGWVDPPSDYPSQPWRLYPGNGGQIPCACNPDAAPTHVMARYWPALDWIVAGGESGPGARPLDLGGLRQLVTQATTAGVPIFVKQLGAAWARANGERGRGGEPTTWPTWAQVRQHPAVRGGGQQ